MSQLTSLIPAGQDLGRVILIHSQAEYGPLVDIVSSSITRQFISSHTISFNVDRFFDIDQINQITSSGSLFDEHTLIRLSFSTKPNTTQQKSLTETLDRLDQNTFLLISCDKLTKTEQKSAWVKTIGNNGRILEIGDNQIINILQDMFKWQNLTISSDALNLLINQNHGNIVELVQAAKLLVLSIPSGQLVDVNKVQELSMDNAKYNIYQLSKNYLAGDLGSSIKILNQLYQAPEDAILITWMIHEDVKRLLKIKNKLRHNHNVQSIIRELGIWGDSIQMLPVAEKRLSYNKLQQIYNNLANLDLSIKGVRRDDIWLLLNQIVRKLCTNH